MIDVDKRQRPKEAAAIQLIGKFAKVLRFTIERATFSKLKWLTVIALCSAGQTLYAEPIKTRAYHSKISTSGNHHQQNQYNHYRADQQQPNHVSVEHRYSSSERYKSSRFTKRWHVRHLYKGNQQRSYNRYNHNSNYKNYKNYNYNYNYNSYNQNYNQSYDNNRHTNNHGKRHDRYNASNNNLIVVPLWVSAPNTGKVFQLPKQH